MKPSTSAEDHLMFYKIQIIHPPKWVKIMVRTKDVKLSFANMLPVRNCLPRQMFCRFRLNAPITVHFSKTFLIVYTFPNLQFLYGAPFIWLQFWISCKIQLILLWYNIFSMVFEILNVFYIILIFEVITQTCIIS